MPTSRYSRIAASTVYGGLPASSIQTSRPVYDSSGLIRRYDRLNSAGDDYPVMDAATGEVVSIQTGKKWTGAIPGQNNAPPVNPNDPNRYQAVEVVKSPAVASATNTLLDAFNKGASATAKGWDDFFNEAKAAQAQNKSAFEREQESFNIAPMADTLRRNNEAFAATSRGIGSRYADIDADYENAQRKLTQEAYDVLPQYESAAQAIADRQLAASLGQVSRYKAASGTPRSLGSSEIALANRAAADVLLPLEREKIARRLGLITDLSMPLEREYATRDVNRLTQFEYPNERYLSERAADTEKQIKQLELAVAGLSRSQAESYLRSLGLPMQIAQEILARHISNLGGIASLEDQSRYRGLQDTQGFQLSYPQGYTVTPPSYPSYPLAEYNYNYGSPTGANSRYTPLTSTASTRSFSPTDLSVINYARANPSSVTARGVVDLPNDFTFGRSPADQRAFEEYQRSFE